MKKIIFVLILSLLFLSACDDSLIIDGVDYSEQPPLNCELISETLNDNIEGNFYCSQYNTNFCICNDDSLDVSFKFLAYAIDENTNDLKLKLKCSDGTLVSLSESDKCLKIEYELLVENIIEEGKYYEVSDKKYTYAKPHQIHANIVSEYSILSYRERLELWDEYYKNRYFRHEVYIWGVGTEENKYLLGFDSPNVSISVSGSPRGYYEIYLADNLNYTDFSVGDIVPLEMKLVDKDMGEQMLIFENAKFIDKKLVGVTDQRETLILNEGIEKKDYTLCSQLAEKKLIYECIYKIAIHINDTLICEALPNTLRSNCFKNIDKEN